VVWLQTLPTKETIMAVWPYRTAAGNFIFYTNHFSVGSG
jgi:hypothetical protein